MVFILHENNINTFQKNSIRKYTNYKQKLRPLKQDDITNKN